MFFDGKPPFDLIPLSNLKSDSWIGRPVFHPHSQVGEDAFWRTEDCPFFQGEDVIFDGEILPAEEKGTSYDVGVVVHFEVSGWRGNEEKDMEVYFLTGDGFTLHYGAYNLWTPRT